jgi:hypothetical protein
MDIFLVNLVAATLRVATPLLLAGIGETYSERAGVLNLGIEGTMFFAAYVGFYFTDVTGSLWAGLVAAIISGALAGLLMALLSVTLGVNQHVSGLGITLLTGGLALFALTRFHAKSRLSRDRIRSSILAPFYFQGGSRPCAGSGLLLSEMTAPKRAEQGSALTSMFGPSPCPGHYSRRWATMASADFCLITPFIAERGAAATCCRVLSCFVFIAPER